MPGAYTYPPDQKLLREKLSYLPKTDTQEAWENFERYWQDRKPVEQKVRRQFAFVGIPYTLLLRAFFALCLLGLSLLFYNTVNAKLPAVMHAPKARAVKQSDALRPIPAPQKQTQNTIKPRPIGLNAANNRLVPAQGKVSGRHSKTVRSRAAAPEAVPQIPSSAETFAESQAPL